jgi:phosphoglycerate dehydrogenase-like enzyme
MEAAQGVELIQFASVGYANIDLESATDLNIPVANNPGWNSISVAEHAMMMMLVLLKQAVYAHQGITQGKWLQRELAFGGRLYELNDKTLGILGLGNIGTEVVKRARAFNPRIIYNKRNKLSALDEDELGVEFRTFDQLLEESDILSVHVPLTDATRGIIGKEELAKMRPGAILINTSRSEVVDEDALADSLRDGGLSGAGIDVPRTPEKVSELQSRFEGIENVFLTPHIAAPTVEALHRSEIQWTDNISRVLTGEKPLYLVNDVWRSK